MLKSYEKRCAIKLRKEPCPICKKKMQKGLTKLVKMGDKYVHICDHHPTKW